MKLRYLLPALLLLFGSLLSTHTFAQTPSAEPSVTPGDISSGVGITVNLIDDNAADGSIVSFSQKGYQLSTVSYDPTTYGVISDTTSVTLEDPETNNEKSRVVLTTGKTLVRVNTQNGAIKSGNLITTSETPGVGMLATQDGYILGTALEDYTESDTSKVGSIYVSLNLGFNSQSTVLRQNLLGNIKNAFSSPFLTPANSLRYIIAGLAVILGLSIGLIHFGRSTANGIEALGRNPLARNAILLSMAVNLVLTIVAMGVGLGLAFLILSL